MPDPDPPREDAEHGDGVETVQIGDRWVNRIIGTGSVVSVSRNRATALAAGAALAREWRVHHHVVYASGGSARTDPE